MCVIRCSLCILHANDPMCVNAQRMCLPSKFPGGFFFVVSSHFANLVRNARFTSTQIYTSMYRKCIAYVTAWQSSAAKTYSSSREFTYRIVPSMRHHSLTRRHSARSLSLSSTYIHASRQYMCKMQYYSPIIYIAVQCNGQVRRMPDTTTLTTTTTTPPMTRAHNAPECEVHCGRSA